MTSTVPASARPPRLLFLEVSGGYFDGLRVAFAGHATCIIGGKGCGKSTLFEMIRFGLYDYRLLASSSLAYKLLKKNLGTGTIRISFETRHGVRYVAERTLKDEQPRFKTLDGEPAKLAPDVFPVAAYSQDEIEEVGATRESQLAVLDRLAGEELAPIALEIAELTASLADSQKVLLELEAEMATLESQSSETRAIEEQLKPLVAGSGSDGPRLEKAHAERALRNRESQALTTASALLTDARKSVLDLAHSLPKKLGAVLPGDVRQGPHAGLFGRVTEQLAGVSGAFEDMVAMTLRRIDKAAASLAGEATELAASHAAHDESYQALLARQNEDQALAADRARLQERHAEVCGAIPVLEERARRHAELRKAHDATAERLVELREQRTRVRVATQDAINAALEAKGVTVKVNALKRQDAYRAFLREAFAPITGNQAKWLVEKIASLSPDQLVEIVRMRDEKRLIAKANLGRTQERAAQVIGVLSSNGQIYALQSMPVDDEVIIQVLDGIWKDTVECSPGQRSGAALSLLLQRGDLPLLVDQPDDNVDPDFMCNVVLRRVGELRGARQFVFVTHHANVVVLSRAEQIAFLVSSGVCAHLQADGDVAKMRKWIVSKLEGGTDAFETRRKAYESEANEDRKE
jgi:DNA repair exonuclease SbcCD ATPase subunit